MGGGWVAVEFPVMGTGKTRSHAAKVEKIKHAKSSVSQDFKNAFKNGLNHVDGSNRFTFGG